VDDFLKREPSSLFTVFRFWCLGRGLVVFCISEGTAVLHGLSWVTCLTHRFRGKLAPVRWPEGGPSVCRSITELPKLTSDTAQRVRGFLTVICSADEGRRVTGDSHQECTRTLSRSFWEQVWARWWAGV
jgi:hypothetical protein